VSNRRFQIQLARGQQGLHLEPGLEDLAAVDALNDCALEDDVAGKVQLEGARGNSQQRGATAGLSIAKPRRMASGWPDISSSTSTPVPPVASRTSASAFSVRDPGRGPRHLGGNAPAVGIHLNGKDLSCAAGLGHSNREEADGAATGNGNGLRGDGPGQHGMHRVSQRVKQRSVIVGIVGESFQILVSG